MNGKIFIAISQCHHIQGGTMGCGTELVEIIVKSMCKHDLCQCMLYQLFTEHSLSIMNSGER